MGFGTLFIGYILLFNIAWFSYTDVLAAAVMLTGLYKLSTVEKHYRISAVFSGLFLLLGGVEFVAEVTGMTAGGAPWYLTVPRYLLLLALTVSVLLGIRKSAKGVGLESLASRCEYTLATPPLVYAGSVLLDLPFLYAKADTLTFRIVGAAVLFAGFVMHVINALTIYKAYAHICLPEDLDMKEKPSRFAFVNRLREKNEEKRKADTEAAIAAMRERAQRKKRKKK